MPVFQLSLLACLLLVAAVPAQAHTIGVSRGEYRAEGSSLDADLRFARAELALAVPGLDRGADGQLSDADISGGRELIARAMANGLEVRVGATTCRGELEQASLLENDGVALRLRYRCAQAAPVFEVRLPLLSSLSLGHRHLVAIDAGGVAPVSHVAYEAHPAFEVTAATAVDGGGLALGLFGLGIEHILVGADHLVFLLGVILAGGKLRFLLVAVTAFTLAHSLTLCLATLGCWAPGANVVEPLIALSIVYVGVENFFVKDASRRWLLTFPFGLVHGFGFAGALQEIALSQAQLPLALLSFNLGVEAGQVLALALALPFMFWLRRQAWFASHGMPVASLLVGLAGVAWFVQRVA